MKEEVGVIQEQGDLGLGFSPITEQEERLLKAKDKESKENDEDQ